MRKILAIKGHPARGKEVIELLKMMGGYTDDLIGNGTDEKYAYFIVKDENNTIDAFPIDKKDEFDFSSQIFTLEEFLEKYPYKVGDNVTIWVEDWENRLGSYIPVKIEYVKWDDLRCEIVYVTKARGMHIFFTAKDVNDMRDNKLFDTVNNPVETKTCTASLKAIEDSIDSVKIIQSGKIVAVCFNTQNYGNEVELQLDDYEIEVRDGKTYAVKKKPKYPTTYDDCKAVMQLQDSIIQARCGYEYKLISYFQQLLMCRDAYWKIAGEQMGLDGRWEPDWNNQRPKYTITVIGNQLIKHYSLSQNYILAFPTEELRDIFYENFKIEIEQCKELL